MSDGEDPWIQLDRTSQDSQASQLPKEGHPEPSNIFLSLKLDGDNLYLRAHDIFSRSDAHAEMMRCVLEKTIRSEPHDRARSFSEIIEILSTDTPSPIDS